MSQSKHRVSYRRVLVRGVNWLGDAVMTTPALQRLRQALPGCHISLLTHEKLADLWTHHPSLDAILQFKEDESLMSMAGRIRQGKFDAALVFPNSPRSALEVWLAGVPERIGHARPWRNFCLTRRVADRAQGLKMRKRSPDEIRDLISSDAASSKPKLAPISAMAHQIHEYLHLAEALGASSEPMPPLIAATRQELQKAAERFGLNARPPLFGLNAGAEYGPAKRWPLDRFIAAAVEIQKRTDCRWIIFGGPKEKILGGEIAHGIMKGAGENVSEKAPGVINLAGKTTLRELCLLLKLCRVLLTNDSGPMHVAAAVGTPVVVPFGSTSPELTGPGLPGDTRHQVLSAQVPCAPCFLRVCPIDMRCMTGIGISQVVEAAVQAAKS